MRINTRLRFKSAATIAILVATQMLCVATTASVCKADLVVRVGNGQGTSSPITVAAGSTATIPVFAQVSSSGGNPTTSQTVFGYDLVFDIGGDGYNLPSGFTNIGGTASGGQFSSGSQFQISTTTESGPNYDFAAGDYNSAGVTVPVGSFIKLFDFTFDVSNAAAPGVYALNFVVNTDPPDQNQFVNSSGGSLGFLFSAQNGSLEVTAAPVPEPTSLAFCGLIGGGLAARWRRKRRKAKAAMTESVC